MTTANNFPDLNISPIRRNTDNEQSANSLESTVDFIDLTNLERTLPVTIDESSAFNLSLSRIRGNPVDSIDIRDSDEIVSESRGPFQIIEDQSLNFQSFRNTTVSISSGADTSDEENSEDNFVEQTASVVNQSSEEAFKKLEKQVEPLLDESDSSIDCGQAIVDEDFYDFLGGIKVFVDVNNGEYSSLIKDQLRQMGAVVSRKLTETTTHIVFVNGGSKDTLNTAFGMKERPELIDPHWVHDCWDQKRFINENNYSLYGGKYLIESLRRVSTSMSFRKVDLRESAEYSRVMNLSSGQNNFGSRIPSRTCTSRTNTTDTSMEMTFDQPMTATQLLGKIDKLSKKLDKLTSCPNEGLSRESSQEKSSCCQPFKTVGTTTNTRNPGLPVPIQQNILRRRTHGAFALAHRAPFSIASLHHKVNRDEAIAIGQVLDNVPEHCTLKKDERNKRLIVNGLNDMKKTVPADLNEIRETLLRNASYRKKGTVKTNNLSDMIKNLKINQQNDDSLGSSIQSFEPPKGRKVVKTASKTMNKLQCIPSSDEFVKNKQSRLKKKEKNGIVFTAFRKRDEQEMKQKARGLGMRIQSEITHNTRCVISATGSRTLTSLRAIVNAVPIVKPDWLIESYSIDKLTPFGVHEYEDWKNLIEKRSVDSEVFDSVGSILVTNHCSPPAEDLRFMIRKSGGHITPSILECRLVVTSPNAEFDFPWTDSPPPIIVGEKYILDCITENELLPVENYISHRIEAISDSEQYDEDEEEIEEEEKEE